MNVIHEGCGILFGICEKIKGTVFEVEFLLCIIDTNSGTVERIINSRNNHGYKYLVKRRLPTWDINTTISINPCSQQ